MTAAIERARFSPSGARSGLVHGLLAYFLWGLLPIYFRLLHAIGPVEVVAHRIVWSVVFLIGLLAVMRGYRDLALAWRAPRLVGALALSALLIAINWLVYVGSVASDHVVAASLGYFLNPLVNVLIGLLFLKEKLRRGQAIAIAVAALGVALLAIGEWQTLWISLTLAVSFAFYGLVRKLTPVAAHVGLAVETMVLAPFALGVLLWYAHAGTLGFGTAPFETILLIVSGAVTSIPLILFASAARQLPMVTLGLMQYVSPSIQFLTGILLFGEHLSPARWASFGLIWLALALFIWDSLRGRVRA